MARDLSRRSVLAAVGAVPVLTTMAAAAVVIDLSARRQTIRGFGGMTHAAWIGDLTAAQRETAFGTGEGRLGFSVLRIPVPENQADWSRNAATARRAAELGAAVIASPWNPPPAWWRPSSAAARPTRDASGTTCTPPTPST
ncbi:glucuronoarabinoxylan endo-1,4-beta-xylanase [Nonomuraea solani]|uniref:Glucuronoarabinoxylan endo-1,4-beta-xylanase n=1 Tax=Nonomuraea solani TaxID=1144553 RepID=A0A1H6F336_9ACTN|nr:glucuronoarabinoxylan endo-1,4-beta-xylanase [Nonomuraea solani]